MRARRTLAELCHGWAGDPAPRSGPRLTASGVPLEFSFRDSADEIRYTADPGPAGIAAAEQWRVAQALVPGVAAAAAPLQRITGRHPRQSGLWLGIRHRGAATDAKAYQQIAPDRAGHVRAALPAIAPVKLAEPLVPVLAGADSRGVVEVYSRVLAPSRATVHRALAGSGAAAAFTGIEACVAELRQRLAPAAWDGLRPGVSVRASPDGVTVTTLFLHAVELFADDSVARARLLELAARLGREPRGYLEATASLCFTAARPLARRAPVHGIVGLTAHPHGAIELTIGVAANVWSRRRCG